MACFLPPVTIYDTCSLSGLTSALTKTKVAIAIGKKKNLGGRGE